MTAIDMNEESVAMMEDCLVADKTWASEHKDLATRFMKASIKGWQTACENPEEAGKIVWEAGEGVSEEHQIYMVKKVAEAVNGRHHAGGDWQTG